jgi:hypothetical protein
MFSEHERTGLDVTSTNAALGGRRDRLASVGNPLNE